MTSDDPLPPLESYSRAREPLARYVRRQFASTDAHLGEALSSECFCCGAYKPGCVCWASITTGGDGAPVSRSCVEEGHGG